MLGSLFTLALALSSQAQIEVVPAYVLAGQSNMVGFGCASELPPSLDQQPDVWTWNHCLPTPAWETLDAGANTGCCLRVPGSASNVCVPNDWFGPEVTLGHALREAEGKPVYLIKFAVGGTYLAPPGACGSGYGANASWDPDTPGGLYADLMAEVAAAAAALPPNKVLNVRGVFWAQGAFDAANSCLSGLYESELGALRARMRADLVGLNVTLDAELPFVVSQVPDYLVYSLHLVGGAIYPEIDTVRSAERAVVCADPRSGMFDPSELSYLSVASACSAADQIHFDTQGQIDHGEGLFEAFEQLDRPPLSADRSWLPAGSGILQDVALSAPGHANDLAVLLGSDSGTAPGFSYAGLVVPLNQDSYYQYTLQNPMWRVLDAQGGATWQVGVPATLTPFPPVLRHHAAVIFDGGTLAVEAVTNPLGWAIL